MKYQKGFTLPEMMFFFIFMLGSVGWGMNIYFLVNNINAEMWGQSVARGLGVIIPPLGAILGYIPF